MKIGIFDSGIGGKAMAHELELALGDNLEIIIVDDHKNVPYGDKKQSEIISLTDAAIQPLLKANCDIILIACNTATVLAIDSLRLKYPNQRFIGIKPMIRTGAKLTKSNIIAVCATPATLGSDRYKKLVKKLDYNLKIIEPDCSDWAKMIENNQINYEEIEKVINDLCDQGADVIVLGCTHYYWIKDFIVKICKGRARVIEPSKAVIYRVERLLKSC